MKRLRYFIEVVSVIFIYGFSKILPVETASNIGGFVARMIGPRLGASRKALSNLNKIYPEKTDQEKQEIVHGMWDNLGRVIFEYAHLKEIAKSHTQFLNDEILKSYKNKPVVFVTAHLANWETCQQTVWYQYGIKAHPVYRPPNNSFVDRLLIKIRSVEGNVKPIPKARSGTRLMVETLQANESLGLLIDQKYNEGLVTDFMGHPAKTADNFIALAKKFDVPIIPVQTIRRQKSYGFDIIVHDPIYITQDNEKTTLTEIHRLFENWINQNPSQWLWLHRRWMTQEEIRKHHEK